MGTATARGGLWHNQGFLCVPSESPWVTRTGLIPFHSDPSSSHTPWLLGGGVEKKKNPLEHLKHRRFFCISKGAVGTSRKKSKAPAQLPVFPGLASLCFDTSQSLTNEAFSPKADSFCPAICSSRCFTLPLPRIKARLGSWGRFFWDESTLVC